MKLDLKKFDFSGFDFKKFDLKKVDWKSVQGGIKKLSSPSAAGDLNRFLEKLPGNAGQTMLMIAGVAWGAAGAAGLFAAVQAQDLTKIRAALAEAQALQPIVPQITDIPIPPEEVKKFVESIKEVYKGVEINAAGSAITIAAKATASFGEFREAVGHVQNGGSGWRVSVDKMCIGRECQGNPLAIALKINKVDVTIPAPAG